MKVTMLVFSFLSLSVYAGTLQIINNGPSGSTGNVEVRANVVQRVSLTVSDTGANDIVTPTGLDFGNVDADGTPGKIPGVALGTKARYVAPFVFSATRSGTGNVNLAAERLAGGNFNNTDGVLIEDNGGTLQALSGSGGAVSVLTNQTEGDYTKNLGVTIYSGDNGALSSIVRFTLSAL